MPKLPDKQWDCGKFRARNDKGRLIASVDAALLETVAVHAEVNDEYAPGWYVSHVPSGWLFLGAVAEQDDAMRIAEALVDRLHRLLDEKCPKRMAGACPSWVRSWLGACDKAKAFVDPAPFVRGA